MFMIFCGFLCVSNSIIAFSFVTFGLLTLRTNEPTQFKQVKSVAQWSQKNSDSSAANRQKCTTHVLLMNYSCTTNVLLMYY